MSDDFRSEVATYFRKKYPRLTREWGNRMPGNDVMAKAIFEVTGWDIPAGKRTPYVHRFWQRHIFRSSTPHVEATVERQSFNLLAFAKRRDFYETAEWRAVRYERLKIDGRSCQCCGSVGGSRKRTGAIVVIHVDHIKSRSLYPELCLSIENTQCLCEDCNIGKGANDETNWRDQTE
jgi:hypothetical protein